MSRMNAAARVLLVAIIVCSTAFAKPPIPRGVHADLKLGEPGSAGGATSAAGSWAVRFPFDPKMRGKVRGYNPGASDTTPTILLHCRSLDPRVMELAARVDTLIADRPELKSSGVYLFDTKGSQPGGFTTEELIQRIKEVKKISDKYKLKVLSIAIAGNSSPKSTARVGLDDSHDVTIVYFTPNAEPNKRPIVTLLKPIKTADLDKKSQDEIVKSVAAAIEPKGWGPGKPANTESD